MTSALTIPSAKLSTAVSLSPAAPFSTAQANSDEPFSTMLAQFEEASLDAGVTGIQGASPLDADEGPSPETLGDAGKETLPVDPALLLSMVPLAAPNSPSGTVDAGALGERAKTPPLAAPAKDAVSLSAPTLHRTDVLTAVQMRMPAEDTPQTSAPRFEAMSGAISRDMQADAEATPVAAPVANIPTVLPPALVRQLASAPPLDASPLASPPEAETALPVSPDDLLALFTGQSLSSLTPQRVQDFAPVLAMGMAAETGDTLPNLNVLHNDAWLDQLSRDIAAVADDGGRLQFKLAPPSLGKLDIALEQKPEGLSVLMRTETQEARTILASSQPQLVQDLSARGIRIADAQVSTSGGDASPRHNSNGQPAVIETALPTESDTEAAPEPQRHGRFA